MENYNVYLIGFLSVAALLLLLNIISGVRQGLGRKLMNSAGLTLGVIVALNVGDGPGKLLQNLVPYPLMIRQYIGAALVGVIIFGFIHVIGILLFQRTKFREGPDRMTHALGGACLGGILGLLSIAACVLMISTSSMLATIVLANTQASPSNVNTDSPEYKRRALATATLVHCNKLNAAIADLPGYPLVNSIELLPAPFVRTFDKALQVSNDTSATDRFMRQPRMQLILHDPRLQHLTRDQELQALAQRRDIHGILSHPKVLAASEDPAILTIISDLELEKALDAALNYSTIDTSNALIPSDAPYQTVPFAID